MLSVDLFLINHMIDKFLSSMILPLFHAGKGELEQTMSKVF